MLFMIICLLYIVNCSFYALFLFGFVHVQIDKSRWDKHAAAGSDELCLEVGRAAGTTRQTRVSNYCGVLKERSCETMKAVTLTAFQLLRDFWFALATSLNCYMLLQAVLRHSRALSEVLSHGLKC